VHLGGKVYYEQMKSNQITTEHYQQQLIDLKSYFEPEITAQRKCKVLRDNTRPHVAKTVKDTLAGFQ